VLTAIQFDDELFAWGAEINDVIANSVLPSEVDIIGLVSA
jgi:hypothetical protein